MEAEEVDDICAAIPEGGDNADESPSSTTKEDIVIAHIEFKQRLAAFEKEFIAFVKKAIEDNFEQYFHFWFAMGAPGIFCDKIESLAYKHFRGIVYADTLASFREFVKHMIYGIRAMLRVTHLTDLSTILNFVDAFCEESFEEIEEWNQALARQNKNNLRPYRLEEEGPEDAVDTTAWLSCFMNGCEGHEPEPKQALPNPE